MSFNPVGQGLNTFFNRSTNFKKRAFPAEKKARILKVISVNAADTGSGYFMAEDVNPFETKDVTYKVFINPKTFNSYVEKIANGKIAQNAEAALNGWVVDKKFENATKSQKYVLVTNSEELKRETIDDQTVVHLQVGWVKSIPFYEQNKEKYLYGVFTATTNYADMFSQNQVNAFHHYPLCEEEGAFFGKVKGIALYTEEGEEEFKNLLAELDQIAEKQDLAMEERKRLEEEGVVPDYVDTPIRKAVYVRALKMITEPSEKEDGEPNVRYELVSRMTNPLTYTPEIKNEKKEVIRERDQLRSTTLVGDEEKGIDSLIDMYAQHIFETYSDTYKEYAEKDELDKWNPDVVIEVFAADIRRVSQASREDEEDISRNRNYINYETIKEENETDDNGRKIYPNKLTQMVFNAVKQEFDNNNYLYGGNLGIQSILEIKDDYQSRHNPSPDGKGGMWIKNNGARSLHTDGYLRNLDNLLPCTLDGKFITIPDNMLTEKELAKRERNKQGFGQSQVNDTPEFSDDTANFIDGISDSFGDDAQY